ncbi:response regulator [Pedobacter sp. SD-b]|uniref:histidine kinase n=1 Tax=Pedobacter segetis TaxID=2793069 RepID=A0ABS1BNV0_9SPHI|nr:response regulator [Pedobacter segetis]MBK0384488.1 response regulator [Pedobacter segetis]
MASKFLRNLQIGFSISFFLLIVSSAASFVSIKAFRNNQDSVQHTLQVLNTLDNINLNLKDRIIGMRGRLLNNNPKFSKSYYSSINSSDSLINNLEDLVSDNPLQIKNVENLRASINKYKFTTENLMDSLNKGLNISLSDMDSGRVQSENYQAILLKMKKIELKLLEDRNIKSSNSAGTTPILLLVTSIISLLITLVFYFRIRSDFKQREALQKQLIKKEEETTESILKIEEIAHQISLGDFKTRVETDKHGLLSKLSVSLNSMAASLEESFNKLNDDEWLQKGIASLNEKFLGNKTIKQICDESINEMINYGQCQVGGLYVFEDGKLILKSSNNKEAFMKASFNEGEGLIGQVFKDGNLRVIDGLGDDYFVTSGSGKIKLNHLLLIPIKNDNITIGVVELGCSLAFADIDIQYHESCGKSIGPAIIGAKSRRHIQNLLEETQTQTEELQAQHNELENLNAELEAQTLKLQASEEELKMQQEELMQSNQELEERSKLLEEKNQLITDRNLEIQQKAEELALSTKYKSEFLANMSHELRTPLNSILLLSGLSAENPEGNLTAEQVESAKVIQSSGNGLLSLIDEILDLSKIEAGKMDVVFEKVALKAVKNELQSLFDPLIKQKGIELNINLDKDAKEIVTDDTRLGQILKNLLSNAIKFTSRGSVDLHIFKKEDDFVFEVRDTGIGISKEKQKLIFEAFQQEDGSTKRKFGGTGLGLSISRELAKLLGGRIELESEPTKGSTFTLILPENQTSKTEAQPGMTKEEEGIDAKPQEAAPSFLSNKIPKAIDDDRLNIINGDKVILIVEDDPLFARTLQNFAQKQNFKTIVVVRGDLALPAALEFKPWAILLDIQLPIMDGWMIMEQLKSNIQTKHIPVHIMSSLQAKRESILKGAVDFINKPFAVENMSSIFQKIETALNKHPKKVLIVEENAKHASALSYYLGNFNISTEIKDNLEESTKTLKEKDVDCVILDMGVPYETGYETLEAIRQTEGLEDLPIIIFTGKNISKVEELKIKKYADSIIVKTAHSYQRVLDEVGLFLHLVNDDKVEKTANSFKKLGQLTEVIKNKTVLIADDDVRNIFSLSKALENHQMKVVSAIDGKEALQKLSEHPEIDIVLMDIMMPEMDGYETIERIRKQHQYKNLPIIAVTAKAMIGDREKCMQVGASDYISKPVDIDQLLSLLRVWLYQ